MFIHFTFICVCACLVCVSGFIKSQTPGRLTSCDYSFSHLVWQSGKSFSYKEIVFKMVLPSCENQLCPPAENVIETPGVLVSGQWPTVNKLMTTLYQTAILHICYFLAGRSIWWKTVTEGLEMLPEATGRWQHFHSPRPQFPPYGLTLSWQITCLFFSCSKFFLQPITNEFVYATLSLNRLARHLLMICKKILGFVKSLRNERLTQIPDKERCVKERIFFDLLYVSCFYVTC